MPLQCHQMHIGLLNGLEHTDSSLGHTDNGGKLRDNGKGFITTWTQNQRVGHKTKRVDHEANSLNIYQQGLLLPADNQKEDADEGDERHRACSDAGHGSDIGAELKDAVHQAGKVPDCREQGQAGYHAEE